jgi:hypothetical protein
MKSQTFISYYKTPGKLILNFTRRTACADILTYVTSTEMIKSELFTSQHDATIQMI